MAKQPVDVVPLVIFVVLNWNQGEMTAQCLDSLSRQHYSSFEVIVIDNGSCDGSAPMLRECFPWVTVLEMDVNLGYSAGNNIGIEAAMQVGADYVLLLNNDTEVAPDMLSIVVRQAEAEPTTGIVGPTMLYADPPDVIWGARNRIDWQRARTVREGMGKVTSQAELYRQEPEDVDYIDTCAALVRSQVFDRIGLMNTSYFINYDDVDLGVRARKAGYRVVYVPSARIWHKVSASMGQASPATTYYMTRNSLLFFGTHAPGLWKVLDPLLLMLRTLRTVAAWTIRPCYRQPAFRRKRDANVLALRDFVLRRFGQMGADVTLVCRRTGGD